MLTKNSLSFEEKIRQVQVEYIPFGHFTVYPALGHSLYERMLNFLPDESLYEDFYHPDAMRPDGSSTRLRYLFTKTSLSNIHEIWTHVYSLFTSSTLQEIIFGKFKCSDKIADFSPMVFLLKDLKGYKISPHVDSKVKAAVFQLYLTKQSLNCGTNFLYPDKKLFKQMPFSPNFAYCFKVDRTSWHSVNIVEEEERDSIMLGYYKKESKNVQY